VSAPGAVNHSRRREYRLNESHRSPLVSFRRSLRGWGRTILLSTAKYGVGISPDSTAYLDVARNLGIRKRALSPALGPSGMYVPSIRCLLGSSGSYWLTPAAYRAV